MSKVVVNPGHKRGLDPGACSHGAMEVDINIKVAELLVQKLQAAGHETLWIHENELGDICTMANEFLPDCFISIHCNAALSADAEGYEVFHAAGYEQDQRLAISILSKFSRFDMENRGIKTNALYVTNHVEAPAVLIELGFITNDEDRDRLLDVECQEEFATAIFDGIVSFL